MFAKTEPLSRVSTSLAWSTDGAQLFQNKMGGNNHGEPRGGVEGTAAKTGPLGSSYPSNWQLSRTESHGYRNESEESDALGSRAQEDLDGAKSPLGKVESETNEKGRVGVVPIRAKEREREFSHSRFVFAELVVLRKHEEAPHFVGDERQGLSP
jgi:hypothetical protein